jgi:hypothetical protein
MSRKLRRFFTISTSERRHFFRAVYYSAIARFLILFIPFRKYSFWLGTYGKETPEDDPGFQDYVRLVSVSVKRAQKVTPWRFKCLEQAMTAKKFLNKKNIPSTIYFGVNRRNGKMNAHAWLRCGSTYVTGGRNRNDFTTVAWFS